MKSAVLNFSIDTETVEGEKLRDLILGGDNKNGWLCVAWVDRTKYNPVELLRQSEEAHRMAVEEAIKYKCEADKMAAWIEKAKDKFIYYGLDNQDEVCLADFCKFASEFSKLIDEAPI